jgi:hypothetical protein
MNSAYRVTVRVLAERHGWLAVTVAERWICQL